MTHWRAAEAASGRRGRRARRERKTSCSWLHSARFRCCAPVQDPPTLLTSGPETNKQRDSCSAALPMTCKCRLGHRIQEEPHLGDTESSSSLRTARAFHLDIVPSRILPSPNQHLHAASKMRH